MNRTDVEDRLANRLHLLAAHASAAPRRDPALADVQELPSSRLRPAALVGAVAVVAVAVIIGVAVTRDSGPVRSRVRVGNEPPSVSQPTEPSGPAVHDLTIEARNFHFDGVHYDVPAGITNVRLVSAEGSHTLKFDTPELAYVSLFTFAKTEVENEQFPAGPNAVKVDFVEGRTYTIHCRMPGHRSSGMEATVTVGSPDSDKFTVATTMPASTIGR